MSAQNNGSSRFVPLPLNSFGTAYVQGKNYTQAGGINTSGVIAIGDTQPFSDLKLNEPTSNYCEILSGQGFDFHTGANPSGLFVDYDARILVSPVVAGLGGASVSIVNAGITWTFLPTGQIAINGVAGTVGQVLTCGAGGVVGWA